MIVVQRVPEFRSNGQGVMHVPYAVQFEGEGERIAHSLFSQLTDKGMSRADAVGHIADHNPTLGLNFLEFLGFSGSIF